MKYDYAVKVNGKWYPPNTEISEETENLSEVSEKNDNGTSGKTKSRNTDK